MLRAHSWLVPLLDGVPLLTSPSCFTGFRAFPSPHWASPELANRPPNALSALCLIAIVQWVGGQLFDRRTGRWAALMFATIPATSRWARVALFDMLFATCPFGGVACLVVGATGAPQAAVSRVRLDRARGHDERPGRAPHRHALCGGGVRCRWESRRAMKRIHWVTALACGALARVPVVHVDVAAVRRPVRTGIFHRRQPLVLYEAARLLDETTSDTYYCVCSRGRSSLEPDRDRARRRRPSRQVGGRPAVC